LRSLHLAQPNLTSAWYPRIFELTFNAGVAKRIHGPFATFVEEIKMQELSKAAKAKARKKMSTKKAALEKEALLYFQKEFQGPRGGGLRVFIPEPQKGGLGCLRLYLLSNVPNCIQLYPTVSKCT